MSQNIKIFKSQNLDRLNELTKSFKKVPQKGFVYVLQMFFIVWGATL